LKNIIYLTPFIPLSFKGEGEGVVFEGTSPLQTSLRSIAK